MSAHPSIHKILIANRGEIALRILRAACLLSIPAVAVYSEHEKDSPWVRHFQESWSLGEGNLKDTYLNAEALVAIAKKSGADAIHPGYGFLSENYQFARVCEENHIRFIGPPSPILKLMGDKLAAHDFISRLGIPVTDKLTDSAGEISRISHELEYPIMVKAAAGGGGKGMRIVWSPHELTGVLEVASHEASQYFSDDRVYVEKYLTAPRHIEVQLLADAHGHIVHLYERECSVQRRHQKIVEEAPAISLSPGLRNRIIDAALAIACAAKYVNAGTVEFLLEESGDFYFLEMNPRIQVEHGVTEMVTGIDIVREQIRIAEGHPLSYSQKDISCRGHAIEARIYAEDPENELLPSPGRICSYREPAQDHVRIESAAAPGMDISADYDPLVAKAIGWGPSREESIYRLDQALDHFIITGIRHNLPLIRTILNDRDFLDNAVNTTYLEERLPTFMERISSRKLSTDPEDLVIAAALTVLNPCAAKNPVTVWQEIGYWRIVPRLSLRYGGTLYELDYRTTGKDSLEIGYGSQKHVLRHMEVTENTIRYIRNETTRYFNYVPWTGHVIRITLGDLDFEIERFDRYEPGDQVLDSDEGNPDTGNIRSPLHGKIARIRVRLNDNVTKGDPVMTIESMKLENVILASVSGSVEQVFVHEGDQIRHHDPLVKIRPNSNILKI